MIGNVFRRQFQTRVRWFAKESNMKDYPNHSGVGGYTITYVCNGAAYCGDCIEEAIDREEPKESEVGSGFTWADPEQGETDVHCDSCNFVVSN